MDAYSFSSILLAAALLIGYINHRFIRMQATIAIMTAALFISLILIILQHTGLYKFSSSTDLIIQRADFQNLLLKGMLSFLLFAGALTINFDQLKSQKWEIGVLASISTIASSLLIGLLAYYLLPLLGLPTPFLYCLLFGALISPTDPIAVLATFKQVGVPKQLQVCVAGESLFNDGVGIVIFTTLYQLTFEHQSITFGTVSLLFLKQAIGGLAYGLLLGVVCYQLIKPLSDQKISILLTVSLVSGGYALALWLGISGPLAMVVFGIYLGHKLRQHRHSQILPSMETFWELIDEILNAVLFLLIGFEMVTIHAHGMQILAMLLAIPLVLLVRLMTVAIPISLISQKNSRIPYTISILTWGGLRGGLALALALSLPLSKHADLLVSLTYGIVAFSVIVQGITVKPLCRLASR